MKYHKIRNVEKSVCTCEQKIAYNLALAHYNLFLKEYNRMPTGMAKLEVILYATNKMIELYQCGYDYKPDKYNIDAISSCLRAGLENYFNSSYKILTTYEEIGKMFPAYYL